MSRLQNRIASAIASAASDANCCDCYSEAAAQAVMAVLIRDGVIASDPETLKLDHEVKAERKRRNKERREFEEREAQRREEMFNRMDPTNTRSTLRRMGWTMSSLSVAPNGLTRLEMWGPDGESEIETATPEMAFPAFLAEVLKTKGGSAK